MKLRKILGVAVVAALALMAFAGTASATTLEIAGVKQTVDVKLTSSLKSGSSALLKDTSGAFANTCLASTVEGTDSTLTTGTLVSGPISSLTFSSCTHGPVVVHKAGTLNIDWISGTTNGTVKSSGAEVTVPATILGSTITTTCKTSETDIGTLTGVKTNTEHATMDINAVLNCGSFLPSAKWEGSYTVTSPTGLGIVE